MLTNPSAVLFVLSALWLLCLVSNCSCPSSSGEPENSDSNTTEFKSQIPPPDELRTATLVGSLPPKGYNRNLRPHHGARSKPHTVKVAVIINDLSAISEVTMDYRVDLYLAQFWFDERLAYPVEHNVSRLTLSEEMMRQLWVPDTVFENAKSVERLKSVSTDASVYFVLRHDGRVTHSIRTLVIAHCPMDLSLFPLDQQRCSLNISSVGFEANDLRLEWINSVDSVSFSPNIFLPTFKLLGYSIDNQTLSSGGDFSQITAYFYLSRSVGYYVSQVYIPSVLVVIISWLPFWLDRRDHHARVGLGVTTVLTMTTLTSHGGAEFPKISYLTAIDVYLFTCFIMVFLSLIEYSVVGHYEYRLENRAQLKMKNKNNSEHKDETKEEEEDKYAKKNKMKLRKPLLLSDTSIIDHWARYLFPGCFALFNLVYVVTLWCLVRAQADSQHIQVRFD